jgi:hypothetical protein
VRLYIAWNNATPPEALAILDRMLSDPRLGDHGISSVAFDAGFGDLSFDRVLRRRYHATPSEIRQVAERRGDSHRH